MIDFWTWTTPNGRKVSILLEELGLPYRAHAVDITQGEQHEPAFLEVSPNNKIPAIRDNETGIALMESGAILIYLAEKAGRFLPTEPEQRYRTLEWLMWQMGGLGPMLGQAHHFLKFNAGKAAYAEERFHDEAQRLYHVLDRRLTTSAFLAGNEYTIADVACWPWVSRYEWQNIDLGNYPSVKRWYVEIASRPAVRRGYHIPKQANEIPLP
ncbi:glutathione S-transferase N-terminal domain-containing protein [Billgrantia kenyensis]|uniref:Glutathione S-transferase n=1 Tax=Billgrantia kenyensis TaxID=321266 RepID=A0A7V9W066_9GAMM|nr:glutathione S-transferase N-terminal domain-containing protein [Halomonas kenyensis]MBA2778512.1 glutathione S-transferase N-terminal domain-containing protein [Halomonas kenyensis]MCG6661683.1 glutathione S-transferase [Halomonas kenyensis]